jgi:hypothetical protein
MRKVCDKLAGVAGLVAVLVAIGFCHAERTDENEELLPQHAPPARVVTA